MFSFQTAMEKKGKRLWGKRSRLQSEHGRKKKKEKQCRERKKKKEGN